MIEAMQKLVERMEKLLVATHQRYPIGQGQCIDMPPQQGRERQWNSGARFFADGFNSQDTSYANDY